MASKKHYCDILLLGRTGMGKSTTGNKLLGLNGNGTTRSTAGDTKLRVWSLPLSSSSKTTTKVVGRSKGTRSASTDSLQTISQRDGSAKASSDGSNCEVSKPKMVKPRQMASKDGSRDNPVGRSARDDFGTGSSNGALQTILLPRSDAATVFVNPAAGQMIRKDKSDSEAVSDNPQGGSATDDNGTGNTDDMAETIAHNNRGANKSSDGSPNGGDSDATATLLVNNMAGQMASKDGRDSTSISDNPQGGSATDDNGTGNTDDMAETIAHNNRGANKSSDGSPNGGDSDATATLLVNNMAGQMASKDGRDSTSISDNPQGGSATDDNGTGNTDDMAETIAHNNRGANKSSDGSPNGGDSDATATLLVNNMAGQMASKDGRDSTSISDNPQGGSATDDNGTQTTDETNQTMPHNDESVSKVSEPMMNEMIIESKDGNGSITGSDSLEGGCTTDKTGTASTDRPHIMPHSDDSAKGGGDDSQKGIGGSAMEVNNGSPNGSDGNGTIVAKPGQMTDKEENNAKTTSESSGGRSPTDNTCTASPVGVPQTILHGDRIMKEEHFPVGRGVHSKTTAIRLISNESTMVRVLDTPGFAQSGIRSDIPSRQASLNVIHELISIKNQLGIKFHCILYFLPCRGPPEKADGTLKDEIAMMSQCFTDAGWKNVVFVLTTKPEHECLLSSSLSDGELKNAAELVIQDALRDALGSLRHKFKKFMDKDSLRLIYISANETSDCTISKLNLPCRQ